MPFPDDRVSATGYNFEANEYQYTPVTIKDKDSGRTFTIQMVNSEIKGNEAKWTIRDGKVYDAQGKTIEDRTIEVTRYQAQILEAAAEAGDGASKQRLNEYDLVGATFKDKVKQSLAQGNSEYHVTSADASESGLIFANVTNQKGETGRLEITLLKEAPQLKEETTFKWYDPRTWF